MPAIPDSRRVTTEKLSGYPLSFPAVVGGPPELAATDVGEDRSHLVIGIDRDVLDDI